MFRKKGLDYYDDWTEIFSNTLATGTFTTTSKHLISQDQDDNSQDHDQ